MTRAKPESSEKTSIPESYWIGQELDWQATTVPVELHVELPYWLMVPDCVQDVEINGHKFSIDIKDNYVELYGNVVFDSKSTCVYLGPPEGPSPDIKKTIRNAIKKGKLGVLFRKCKTILIIRSDCNKDVLLAIKEEGKRKNPALLYLKSFCEAHFDVINRLIQQYRLSTYDYFAYELSPWDVPIWFVVAGADCYRIVLQEYCAFDEKPVISSNINGDSYERYKIIDPPELKASMAIQASSGEFELMDALNFMERGDYTDAVRRITTAIEAQTESVLRQELLKIYPISDVKKKLKASENNFPSRLAQYQKLSGRKMNDFFEKELKITRTLRHSIVHQGKRITFSERGKAQKAVDVGRWIFNWLENQPDRSSIREKTIGKRSLGRHFCLYNAEITPVGVVVHKPPIPTVER